jgi:hypothetical protein
MWGYAGCWIWTSENCPSTSLGELRASPGPYHLISSGVQDFACVRNPIQTLVVADLIATGPTMKIVRVLVACLVVEVYKDIVAPAKVVLGLYIRQRYSLNTSTHKRS